MKCTMQAGFESDTINTFFPYICVRAVAKKLIKAVKALTPFSKSF